MTAPAWKLDTQAVNEALRILSGATCVLMPMHQNVDADGLSSPLAMMHALRQQGIKAIPLASDGEVPHNLEFLPGIEEVIRYGVDPLPEYDVLCMIDCADRRRLGDFYADDPSRVSGVMIPIVNIDHHVTNDNFGVVNIVSATVASAAEVVTDILAIWGTELTTDLANLLLAGIYGDTLGLRTESTTSRTMRTAADLVDAGGNPGPIIDALFRIKPKSSVCLWNRALSNHQWTGSLIWTELTEVDFSACGAKPVEAEGLVNFLLGTEGSNASAILYASPGRWRVSMRSIDTRIDVAAIAAEFGGGGHPRAAGCTIEGNEADRDAFLARVAELAEAAVSQQES